VRASGVGSVLDLRNAVAVTNGSMTVDSVAIDALAGGRVDLRAMQQVLDPAAGDTRSRAVLVTADGTNSVVDLTALAQMTDQTTNDDYNQGVTHSRLTAQNLGRIVVSPVQAFATRVFVLTQTLGTIQGNVVLGPGSIREDR